MSLIIISKKDEKVKVSIPKKFKKNSKEIQEYKNRIEKYLSPCSKVYATIESGEVKRIKKKSLIDLYKGVPVK